MCMFYFPDMNLARKMNKARTIIEIPITEYRSGDSSGRSIQLNTTPVTGTTNFQTFSSDTLTSGRFKRVYHIEKATAGIIDNHNHAP